MMSSLELRNCRRKMLMFKLRFPSRRLISEASFFGFVVVVGVTFLHNFWRFGRYQAEVLLHVTEVDDGILLFFKRFCNFGPDVVFAKDLVDRQLAPRQGLHFVLRLGRFQLRQLHLLLG